MNKCDCYFTKDRYYGRFDGFDLFPDYQTVGYCNGTKERDICHCEGDRTMCDFYPEVREKAFKETSIPTEDCLIVAFDNAPYDDAVLSISRQNGAHLEVVNEFKGEEAITIYKILRNVF